VPEEDEAESELEVLLAVELEAIELAALV